MGDTTRTPSSAATCEIEKIKGSRFIGHVVPVTSEIAARQALEDVRAREAGATHHCWAWRIGATDAVSRWSDDGEPSGTAGAPILRQVEARGLTNVVVVVSRYYGGTKLGRGGLIRAYGAAAADALDAAGVQEQPIAVGLRLRFAYDRTASVTAALSRSSARVVREAYGADAELTVAVAVSEAEELEAALREALAGRGEVSRLGD